MVFGVVAWIGFLHLNLHPTRAQEVRKKQGKSCSKQFRIVYCTGKAKDLQKPFWLQSGEREPLFSPCLEYPPAE